MCKNGLKNESPKIAFRLFSVTITIMATTKGMVKSEFALALNQVATERGISVADVISSMESAILAAFKKEHPEFLEDEEVGVKVSQETGETQIIKDGKDITPPGFGRIAAQTARQVIIQKIREAEKKTVISQYQEQIGSIIKGRVIRYDGYNAYIDLGKAIDKHTLI